MFELDYSVHKGARGFVTGARNICMSVLSVMSGARNVCMGVSSFIMGVFSLITGARIICTDVLSFMSGAFSLNGRVKFNPFHTGAWQIDETDWFGSALCARDNCSRSS